MPVDIRESKAVEEADLLQKELLKQKQAEEALRESEERLSVFMDSAPDAFALFDSELDLVEVNRVGLGMFPAGTKKEDVIGKNITELYPAMKEAGRYDKYLEVIKSGKSFFVDDLVPDPKFGDVHLAVRAFKVGDGLGIIVTDISERKRAEEALRESEGKYRDLFENANDLIQSVDIEAKFLYVNRKWLEVLEYTKDEVEKLTLMDVLRKDQIPHCMELFEKISCGEAVDQVETVFVSKNGKEIPVEGNVNAQFKDGKFVACRGIFRDITERKRAEEALQQAEEKYRGIFENAVVGIYQTTIDGDYLTANPTLARILGYESPKELMATVTDVEHQFYVEPGRRAEFIRLVQEQGTVSGFESQVYRKDGSVIWVSETGRSLRDANGRVMGFEGTTVDITERKQVEEEISHRSKQLALINEVGQRIAPILELNELHQTVVEAVQEKFGYQYVAIFLVRDQEVALEAVAGLQTKSIPSGYTQRIGEGMVGWVAKHGQTLLANDVTKEARFLPLEFLDIAAELDVPIRLGGKTIGVLTVDSDRPDTFTEADVTTLETIADQVARAIENARLYEEIQARSAYLETLLQINATLRSTLPLSQVLETIVQGATEALGYVGSLITVPDATGERLVFGAAWGGRFVDAAARLTGFKVDSFSLSLKAEENPIVQAYLTGGLQTLGPAPERIVVGVEPPISPKVARTIERTMGAKLAACVPLRVAEKAVGVLTIFSPREQLPDDERAMLLGLADQAGLAIENARLYEELRGELTERKRAEDEMRQRSEELAALNAIAMTVTSTLDLQEVLRTIQERVVTLLGEKYPPFFSLFDEGSQTIKVVVTGTPKKILERAEKLMGVRLEDLAFPLSTVNPAVREALLAGKPYVTDDVSDLLGPRVSRRLVQGAQSALGIKFIVDLPLSVKGKFVGIMALLSQKERVSDEEMELLSSIASQAAIAIENAQAYQRLKTQNLETISALAAAVEAKDPYTSGHSEEVTQFAIAIAEKMGLSNDEIEDLQVGALLHDIGKIGIPDSVLNKPARLTSAEFLMIKAHPAIAAEIVGKIEALAHLVPIIRHHHERYDGQGYPDSLKGKEIPLGARILAVADGFEAMTSERPYRRARTEEEALEELQKGTGTQWDPQVVEVFVKIYEEGALEHQASDQ